MLVRSIVGPLNSIKDAMSNISGGDLETPVPKSKNEDETAEMAQALEVIPESGVGKQKDGAGGFRDTGTCRGGTCSRNE